MDQYGNTSSASIPLALCAKREQVATAQRSHTMMVGFGTGFSLSAVHADLSETMFFDPVDVE
jgi:3-oxoacyl-[acyl-carrier-protein] synthase-3